MSYMIEGQGSKTMSNSKKWLYADKVSSHKLLQLITDVNVLKVKCGEGKEVRTRSAIIRYCCQNISSNWQIVTISLFYYLCTQDVTVLCLIL